MRADGGNVDRADAGPLHGAGDAIPHRHDADAYLQPHQRPGAGHRPRWLIPRRRQRARTANPYGGIHLTVLGLIRADSTGAGMLAAPLAPVYVANGRYVTALA